MALTVVPHRTLGYRMSRDEVEKLTNLVGFLAFAAIAMWTLSRMPTVGILLIPTFVYELMTGTAFLLRDRAKARHSSRTARIASTSPTRRAA